MLFADFGNWSMLLTNPFHTINEQLLSNKIKEMGDWGSLACLCKFYARPSGGDSPCPPQTSQWALQRKQCPTPRTRILNTYPVFTFTAFLAVHTRKSRMHHLGRLHQTVFCKKYVLLIVYCCAIFNHMDLLNLFRYGISKQKQILCFLLVSISKNTFYCTHTWTLWDMISTKWKEQQRKPLHSKLNMNTPYTKRKNTILTMNVWEEILFTSLLTTKRMLQPLDKFLLLLRNNLFSTWTQELSYRADKSIVWRTYSEGEITDLVMISKHAKGLPELCGTQVRN